MDDFERAAAGVAGNEFDTAAAGVVDDQKSGLRNTLYDALLSNPEVAARATRLGRQTGLAPDLVERNLPEVERTTRLDQLDALPKDNPVLANWLADPVNARLSHDDLDTMGQLGKAALFRAPTPKLREGYGFAQASRDLRADQDRAASAVSQYVDRNMPASEIMGRERTTLEGFTEPVLRGVARARRGITLLMGMGGLYEGDEAGLMVRLANQNRKAESYPVPESVQAGQQAISGAEGFGEAAWAILTNPSAVKEVVLESLGASSPSLLGAGALSVFGPAGTAAGAGLGSFVVEYSSTIQSVMDENGVNASDPMALSAAMNNPDMMDAAREKALSRGVPVALFDALTAGFAGKLLLGAKNTAGSAGVRAVGELGLQAGGGAAGEATAQYATGEFKPGDILLEAIAELPTGVIEVPANYRHAIDKAQRAEQQTQAIEELNNLAQASKVAQRDPESFQSFIAQATEDGPVQNVFVDGRFLMQSGMAPRLSDMSPAVREQLDRAILTNGQIAIPIDEYAARIAPTDLAPQLLDHLRVEPDGFSRAEMFEFRENQAAELEAEVQRILSEKQGDETFKASQEAVKAQILEDMNRAGRFSNAANEVNAMAFASYYAARAAQKQITPEELYQQRKVKFVAQGMEGQRFDQGGKLVTDTPAFKNWFGDSKVADADGKPLVVYHGSAADFTEFDVGKAGSIQYSDWGKGIYLTPREGNADYYRVEAVKSLDKEYNDAFARYEELEKGTQTINGVPQYSEAAKAALAEFQRIGREKNNTEAGKVYSLYANIKNPYIQEYTSLPDPYLAERAASKGHDGIFVLNGDGSINEIVAFSPEQVKSATGNNTFDPNDPNILNQSAFHGSPYKFDKFSLEHMGKGEGAQAYGWGLYFAGNKEVAEFYREQLRPPTEIQSWSFGSAFLIRNGEYQDYSPRDSSPLAQAKALLSEDMMVREADIIAAHDKDGIEGARKVMLEIADERISMAKEDQPEIVTHLGIFKKRIAEELKLKVNVDQGQLYEVNIPEDDTFLLWDKPLSEQPEKVRGLLIDVAKDIGLPVNYKKKVFWKNITGEDFYRAIGSKFANGTYYPNPNGEYKAASELLASWGISGIKYLDGSSRSAGEGHHNYVIFDDKAVQILQTYYQPDGGGTGNRASFSPDTLTVAILKGADLSSVLHEGAHFFFENDIFLASELVQQANAFGYDALKPGERQILADVSALMAWHGIQGGIEEQLRTWHNMEFEEKRSHHERTAESFEKYLFEGKAPSIELAPYFQKFRAWMLSVYRSITDFLTRNPEAGKLSDEVRAVFDRMLATNEQIMLAEQGRSMMPLFASPDQAGMTPEDFAAYQALGIDATNDAIQDLQAKGLRDMQWLHNARGRAVKRLQKESKARRAEVMMEARREVMSQPVYRAWDFLTRKLDAADKTQQQKSDPATVDPLQDSLLMAIAKLGGISKDFAVKEWGIDPKSKPQSGVFGKPVWRVTGGEPADLMAEQLARLGYLEADADGKLDLDGFYDRFAREINGEAQYSSFRDYEGDAREVANPGGLNAGRLDLAAMPAEVGEALKARRMTASDGLSPDLVAELFEFSSGDELVRALAEAVPPKDAINAMTDQRMLEAYGELATPEAIEREADKAIHNEARARMVATEMNALAKAAGKPRVMASAAKEFAAAMIARLKVRDIRPSQYSSAAVRAAKATEAAVKAGNTAEAAAEKRNHLVNLYATRAAHDAQDEVDSGLRYFKRFDKRSKTLDAEYQDQIEAMLERFDLRRISNKALDRRASLAQWIESQREAGIEPDLPPELENEALRKSYKDMTVEEFRGLVETVKQIEHLGRLKNKLLTAQDQREFAAIVDEVLASIVENGGDERPVELEQPSRIVEFINNFRASHRKLASLIRQMDGGKDAGPFWRVFVRGMNDAGTREASMTEDATERLMAIYQPMLELKGGLHGDKRFIQAINASLTRGGRLSVALNWGNETNRLRVMEGDGWTEYQVQEILNTLTRAEWQFVQDVWAFIDSYWPQIEAKEKRVTGRAPDKVKALPFTVMVDGENVSLSGGYYPIKYDSNRDDRAEKHEAAEIAEEMKRGAYTRATTRRGHTKARTESVKRPVKKTLDVITQHVSEVTHDLAWHEWLIDANRLLDAKPINQAIRTHYGTAVVRTMKDALTGIAVGEMGRQTALDTAMLYLRANVSRSTMGFSLTTAFLQPFGLLQSAVRIGGKHVMHGIGRWAGDVARMESTMKWVGEKSEFMRLRNKTFNRELHEIRNRVSHGHSKIRTVYDASLFMLMQKMQMVADIPTWIGAYDKALGEGFEGDAAVALADQAVLDSQGGGQNKDLAEIQRKWPMLTVFYSYFSTTLNLAAESTAQTDFKNPLAVAGWLSDMMLLMVIPALGPAMILALMRGENCWEEGDCARELVQAQLGYTLGTVVGVRELSGMAQGFDYAGPPAGRVIADLGKFGTQVSQGEVDEAATLSAVRLFGTALGIPTVQIVRSWRGWQAWEEGDAPATSILMGPPPKD